jgi:ceramide glucosyltransferase
MSLALVIAIMLVPSWAYLIGSAAAAICFARRALPTWPERPPVSILKPLHGAEPGLYENLLSFAEQDYPTVQVVLGVNDGKDTALPVADALIRDLPAADIALVLDPPVRGSNLKIANLENMLTAARHDIIVIADSDMRVGPHYLAAVAAPLSDPSVGLVTCLYEGVSTGGFWSELGALHINFGFFPGALVAATLDIGHGCFGATIALRRQTLDRIGGFAKLRDELADDRRLGDLVRGHDLTVVLSRYVVEARVSEPSFASLWLHELRWARTVRAVTPAGFAGSIVAHPVALALLGAAASRFALTPVILLAISCLLRWGTALVIAGALQFTTVGVWVLPARDLLSFAVFIASFLGKRVSWRDQVFRVGASGRMTIEGDNAR